MMNLYLVKPDRPHMVNEFGEVEGVLYSADSFISLWLKLHDYIDYMENEGLSGSIVAECLTTGELEVKEYKAK